MATDLQKLEQELTSLPPRERLRLIQRLANSLEKQAQPATTEAREVVERQRRALIELQCRLANVSVARPADGFTGADHDDLLYGDAS